MARRDKNRRQKWKKPSNHFDGFLQCGRASQLLGFVEEADGAAVVDLFDFF